MPRDCAIRAPQEPLTAELHGVSEGPLSVVHSADASTCMARASPIRPATYPSTGSMGWFVRGIPGGPSACELLEPDALVVAALGVQEERHQGDLEEEVDEAAAEQAGVSGDDKGKGEQRHPDAQDVSPLALVGDAVSGQDAAGDHQQAERSEEAPENQGDDPVEVEQENRDLQGLRLRLVDPPALFHAP